MFAMFLIGVLSWSGGRGGIKIARMIFEEKNEVADGKRIII